MRFVLNRALLGSIGVQALGSMATLLLGFLIARYQGPDAQGLYGVVRTTADLLLSIALFGFPQGVVHLMNHRAASPALLNQVFSRYLLILTIVAGVSALLLDRVGLTLHADWKLTSSIALLVGVLGWVAHGLQRSFVLCLGSPTGFSWMTATPALTLLGSTLVLMAWGSRNYEWAIAVSGTASWLFGRLSIGTLRARPAWTVGGRTAWRELLPVGTHAMVQTVAVALLPWLVLQVLHLLGADLQELGWFVMAGYMLQLFLLPAGFVVPLVYARVSRAAAQQRALDLTAGLLGVALVASLIALVVALLLPFVLVDLLGPSYAPAVVACICMTLGGPAAMLGRVATALMQGEGRFKVATYVSIARVILVGGGTVAVALLVGSSLGLATAAALAWSSSEFVVTAVMFAKRMWTTTAKKRG